MNSFVIFFISTLIFNQTLGYYVPIKEVELPSCGCGGGSSVEIDLEPKDDGHVPQVRYGSETKSYDNPRSRRSSGFSRRFNRDVPFRLDSLLPMPFNADTPFNPFGVNNFPLMPSEASGFLRRFNRDVPFNLDNLFSTLTESDLLGNSLDLNNVFPSKPTLNPFGFDDLFSVTNGLRDHFGKLASTPNFNFKEHIENIASKVHPLFKDHMARYADVFDVDAFKDGIEKLGDSLRANSNSQAEDSNNDDSDQKVGALQQLHNEFGKHFSRNFDALVKLRSFNRDNDLSAPDACDRRKRRSVDEPQHQDDNGQYPILKVKENPITRETMRNEKKLSPTKCLHCVKCGSQLSDSVCQSCGLKQPQYIEYIHGKAVAYYPRLQQKTSQKSLNKKRYIFDRYGHKYLESKGNLRLITPQQQQKVKN